MKIKFMILLLGLLILVGCQTGSTVSVFEAGNGDKVKVVISPKLDKATEEAILDYIKNDANNHYATSNEPYKFVKK